MLYFSLLVLQQLLVIIYISISVLILLILALLFIGIRSNPILCIALPLPQHFFYSQSPTMLYDICINNLTAIFWPVLDQNTVKSASTPEVTSMSIPLDILHFKIAETNRELDLKKRPVLHRAESENNNIKVRCGIGVILNRAVEAGQAQHYGCSV